MTSGSQEGYNSRNTILLREREVEEVVEVVK